MKEKMLYIADDGTIFENRNECENYEAQVEEQIFKPMIEKGHLKMWNYEGEEQKKMCYIVSWANGHYDSILSRIRFIKIRTEEAYEALHAHCEKFGAKCPPGTGNWVWIEDDRRCKYGWYDPAEYYKEDTEVIDFCREHNMMPEAE